MGEFFEQNDKIVTFLYNMPPLRIKLFNSYIYKCNFLVTLKIRNVSNLYICMLK